MRVKLSLIAAMTENGVIGRNNAMPWRLSSDLKRFKALTLGKPVIMGRKTWGSLGRPLAHRLNIVITRDPAFRAEGASLVHTLDEARQLAVNAAQKAGLDEIFVIGGSEIFRQALPYADKMYLTEILTHLEGDTYFPPFVPGDWQAVFSEMLPAGEKDEYPTRFVVYERNSHMRG
ncbi:MAG: Dihydrofolate reductase [Candidatus Tokpelaia hoelldobleri]|uniref:Dihydrofolate reductase n=1 Tax=Candidatus Tokpelaia hoelldobleri TaxID=1902579 RepID=A0A1U9JVS8_9HYPH|nr:MAG: Dihydrofolate reductase [Candidatus Tokpelaia hoelldoblerii]